MKRFIKSFSFAVKGIQSGFVHEANFKIHSFCAILVIIAGVFLQVNKTEWILLTICIAMVMASELVNSALEQLCNIVYKEEHAGIKLVKDISAAAVLIIAFAAAICGSVIFIPKIIFLLKSIIE